jgi:hypothetical protein
MRKKVVHEYQDGSPSNAERPTFEVIKDIIDNVARSISRRPIGLARHKPEPSAEPSRCFENVGRMVEQKKAAAFSTVGPFMFDLPRIFRDQAVWHAPPKGELIDVTPYPDERHKAARARMGPL